ncbi:glycosyltransferase family 4 protein [Snuella sedimenti]|uniref:Glycosyltransferase family 4 protein n=1 Tax=Snuella sedimenti TaxID=2798802 RepID=A0A8J7J3R9_9FLAO|nr:glycosyltransferase family 4 protein [Snuella sedimenti]MBJ6367913.1 glycosyltransferase family 4 protein [Snuella sedimenti]
MKIGLVLSKTPAYSETFFISKIKGLQASGIEVVLFVQYKAEDFVLCPVWVAPKVFKRNLLRQLFSFFLVLCKVLNHYKRFRYFLLLEKRAGRSLKQGLKNAYSNAHILEADLDWLHFGFATMALQSEHVAKAIGANMAVSFRGFDLDVYPLKYPGCYDLLWKQVDKVHSISIYLLQKAYAFGLQNSVPYQVITPAVDLSLFKERQLATSRVVHLVTVARLHWIKGLEATLEALVLLKAQGFEFKYTIIGSGPEYEALMFAIYQLGLTAHVDLVGKLSHKATLELLSKADIYIQYSYSEGFCNAVLEAQVMGLLCVVSDGGGLPENVIDGKTGWVVPRGNPRLLFECITTILKASEDERSEIRCRAKSRVLKEFNMQSQHVAFKNFYETSIS